ncbi:MarR family transcriptional regulator [Solibacillus sp. MA9]|uniref:MarR family transcriptional regulator n=1 Tax=Solibacillus palustris TaxID=2908203 RepID=A0ABS9UAK9_9BACL|nr:MarR family transcriptional regulator [Solibacillus sp. MA9]MCH7321378.1 MarR family transcriptional regulator [Solibacillus sp. MA9]
MNPLFHMFFQKNRQLVNHLNEALKEHGLFHSQWSILFLLHKNGPMSLTEIWKYLNVEAPTITRTATRLQTLGWIVRVEGADKREKIIALSDFAKEQFPHVEASVLAFEAKITQQLSQQEELQLIELLKKLEG